MAGSVTPAPASIHVVVPGVGNHLGVTGDNMSRRSSHSRGWGPGGMGWHSKWEKGDGKGCAAGEHPAGSVARAASWRGKVIPALGCGQGMWSVLDTGAAAPPDKCRASLRSPPRAGSLLGSVFLVGCCFSCWEFH